MHEDDNYLDEIPEMRSKVLEQLLLCLDMSEETKIVTDIAFNQIDVDGSGTLESCEIVDIFKEVAKSMDVKPPSESDINNIMQ